MHTEFCALTGERFEICDKEAELRRKFSLSGLPPLSRRARLRELGAFWHHWNLYRRPSSLSGTQLIGVYSEDCPYPVWHHKEWLAQADPPGGTFSEDASFFEQLWRFFPQCPIPHATGAGSENCEYTDDWWYSRNCYLCHSGYNNEDIRYCYRALNLKNCRYCVFSFDSELCSDLVNCRKCFQTCYAINCRSCTGSAFLYDCRNCDDCLFCVNLRHKRFCIFNRQHAPEQYAAIRAEWDLRSRRKYEEGKKIFADFLVRNALHRAVHNDLCSDCIGDYLENCKNCRDVYFAQEAEDSINYVRGYKVRDQLHCVGNLMCELSCCSVLAQDNAYDIRFCFNVVQSRFLEYSAFCFQCEHCFGCCGLVGRNYCIMNKQYTPADYEAHRRRIVEHMRRTGEYGLFFPGRFAANPYDESWSSAHFPLSLEKQVQLGFRTAPAQTRTPANMLPASAVPDAADAVGPEDLNASYWDAVSGRPFRLLEEDLRFCRTLGAAPANRFYASIMRDNYGWLHFDGGRRPSRCAASGLAVSTTLPLSYEGRILCEQEYQKAVG